MGAVAMRDSLWYHSGVKKRQKRRNVIVFFDISSIAGRDQLAGVFRFLKRRPGWVPRLITIPSDFSPEVVRNAKEDKIDGFIINNAGSAETERELAKSDIPLAVIGIRNPRLIGRKKAIALIRNDNIETGRIAARHFLSLGNFRSFGYIPASDASSEWSVNRYRGFADEIRAHGGWAASFQCAAKMGSDEWLRRLASWLKGLPKPAAVLGAWDYQAVQAMEVCRAERIRVPQEVSVLGVDNDPLICDVAIPPLSSVPFDYEQEGYESAAALDRLMEKPALRSSQMKVICHPLKVFVRESSVPIAPATQLIKQALRFISLNATKGISTRDVAKHLGISQSLLALRFREYQRQSVLAVIQDVRLEVVRRLLGETHRSIGEITAAAGFRNANHLKALFHRKFGMSMREWRAQNGPTSTAR